jgi:hypothetical protein
MLHSAHTGGHDYPNWGDTSDWQTCVDILHGEIPHPLSAFMQTPVGAGFYKLPLSDLNGATSTCGDTRMIDICHHPLALCHLAARCDDGGPLRPPRLSREPSHQCYGGAYAIGNMRGRPLVKRYARSSTIRYLPHQIAPSGIGTGGTFWSEQIGLLPHVSQKKSAGLQTISLRRIPKELLAGRRVILKYLRQMKISALRRDDKETSDLVDKTLAHWLSMGPMEEQYKNPLAETEFFSNLTWHMASISDIHGCDETFADMDFDAFGTEHQEDEGIDDDGKKCALARVSARGTLEGAHGGRFRVHKLSPSLVLMNCPPTPLDLRMFIDGLSHW